MRDAIVETGSPIAHFIGHSLATSLGLAALTVVFLIPAGIVYCLKLMQHAELGATIEVLDPWLIKVELGFFGIVMLIGLVELVALLAIKAIKKIQRAWRQP